MSQFMFNVAQSESGESSLAMPSKSNVTESKQDLAQAYFPDCEETPVEFR